MNSISADQNTDKVIDRLAAQRQVYSLAKGIQAGHILFGVVGVVGWSIAGLIRPDLKVYGAYWAVSLTLLDVVVLTPWQQSLKKDAAKIQEVLDCDLLKIEWSDAKVGKAPDGETIAKYAAAYRAKHADVSDLKDWYPASVGGLPLYLAKLICQRTNCWWDAELRRRYARAVLILLILAVAVIVLLGIVGGLTVDSLLLSVISPILPIVVIGMRHYRENLDAASALDRAKEHAESLWRSALSGSFLPEIFELKSRELQDLIFENRKSLPLIFDWVYGRLRRPQEDMMTKGAKEMVEEANIALGTEQDSKHSRRGGE